MKPIIKKLLHEFWLAKGKFVLCVLATAIAGWGVSTVTYSYLMAERDFHENFEATRPADITLSIENYSESLRQSLLKDSQVADIERREMLSGRIMNNKGTWMTLILFGVEDFDQQRMDVFRVSEKSDGVKDFILIERNANDFLDYFSDSASMQFLPKIQSFKLPKAGLVHDARQAPAQMERVVYGYTLIETIDSLLQPGKARILIKTKNVALTKDAMDTVAQRLTKVIAQQGALVTSVTVPTPGEHIHQPIIDGIAFLQKSFGLVLVILGITLLSLILLTWLFPQLIQVGIIKALGASSAQIYKGYMVVLLIVIICGLAIGLPLGVKSAELFNRFIAMVQNFEVIKDPFPVYVHLAVAGASSVLPFLFGIGPIRKMARVTVREALAMTFHSTDMRLVRWVQKIFASVKWRYSGSNLLRSGMRTYLLIALLSVGIGLFFTGSNLSYSFYQDFSTYYKSSSYQITIGLSDTSSADMSFIDELPSVEATALLLTKRISYEVPDFGRVESASLKIYPQNYLVNESLILQGTVDKRCNDCVFIHPAMLEKGFKNSNVGDTITVLSRSGETKKYRYVGVMKEMGGVHGGGMLFHFTDQPAKFFGQIAVRLKPGVEIPDALKQLEQALREKGVKYSGMSDVDTNLEGSYNHFKPTYYIVQGIGLFTIVVAFMGMIIVVNLTIQERTLEIGILKAMGAQYRQIAGVMSIEFLVLSIIAMILGTTISVALAQFLCTLYGEMVRGQSIPALLNYNVVIVTIVSITVIQILMIGTYCRARIRKTSNALLNYVG